jgi:hypothetical protein
MEREPNSKTERWWNADTSMALALIDILDEYVAKAEHLDYPRERVLQTIHELRHYVEFQFEFDAGATTTDAWRNAFLTLAEIGPSLWD